MVSAKSRGGPLVGHRWEKPWPRKCIFWMTVSDSSKCHSSGLILLFCRGVFLLKHIICSSVV